MDSLSRFKILGIVLFSCALIIGGCGKNGNSGDNAPDGSQKDDAVIENHKGDNVGGSKEHADGFGFTDFELEIDVDGKDAISTDFDVSKRAEAEYENKIEVIDVEGEDAMNELNKLFVNIELTKETPKEKVMEEILDHFGIDDYTKFELDVIFDDGTHLNINEVK